MRVVVDTDLRNGIFTLIQVPPHLPQLVLLLLQPLLQISHHVLQRMRQLVRGRRLAAVALQTVQRGHALAGHISDGGSSPLGAQRGAVQRAYVVDVPHGGADLSQVRAERRPIGRQAVHGVVPGVRRVLLLLAADRCQHALAGARAWPRGGGRGR